MKKTFVIMLVMLGLVSSVFFSLPTWAAECGSVDTIILECNNTGAGSIREIILNVIDILSIGVGILGVIGISIVGIQYLTAGGSEEKTKKAKLRIFEIIIGLVVYAVLWTGLQWLTPGGVLFGEIEVTSVSLGTSSFEIEKGSTRTLTPTLMPVDADNSAFSWSSSDNTVVNVDDRGKVTAKALGSAVITVTTSNGKTASVTVNVVENGGSGSATGGNGGNSSSGGNSPSGSDRYRLGSAFAVRHAANNGNIDTVREAVNGKYWGVECDTRYYSGTLMCYHESKYLDNESATLAETINVCKAGGSKTILDLKIQDREGLTALGNYIKDNNLQDWVVVQTSNQNSMQILNEVVGGKLEYWGLVMRGQTTLDSLINDASTYQGLGMTTVNVPLVAVGYPLGTNENIRRLQSAGYDVAAFTWVIFSSEAISNYDSLGVKYLMTNGFQ